MELYIHIPFCRRKCDYCSFVSFPGELHQKEKYIRALLDETELRQAEFSEPVQTVFIGGGTPSLLSSDQLKTLVTGISDRISLSDCVEFTIEANPGTLTEDFTAAAVRLGINRFSLGMQAYQDSLLQLLGRIHTYPDVVNSVSLLNKYHISNFNLDLIFGIPGQTLSQWDETLSAALSLRPAHISAYGLVPEEGTPLFRRLTGGELSLPEQENEREMYDLALRRLSENGYSQYEISNFARDGFVCRHNIGYWTQVPYVGLGVSAASMTIPQKTEAGISYLRKKNPDSLAGYYEMINLGCLAADETESVSPKEARFETLMLSLRMNKGINELRFLEMHGITIDSCYGSKLAEMEEKGLMKHESGTWSLTRKGMDIQNTVLIEFMEDS